MAGRDRGKEYQLKLRLLPKAEDCEDRGHAGAGLLGRAAEFLAAQRGILH
jgi:hypothetical protein